MSAKIDYGISKIKDDMSIIVEKNPNEANLGVRREPMIKVGVIHQVLAYLAAAAAVVSVILAGVSRVIAQPVGFALFSWMIVAGVAMLFAIYFFAGGIFFRNTQVRSPLAALVRKRRKIEPFASMLKDRVFSASGDNKGLVCPFKSVTCQNGYCEECQIYLDWQRLGEILVACAWCGKEIAKKPGLGQSGVSHGMCPECWQKHFAKVNSSARARKEAKNVRL